MRLVSSFYLFHPTLADKLKQLISVYVQLAMCARCTHVDETHADIYALWEIICNFLIDFQNITGIGSKFKSLRLVPIKHHLWMACTEKLNVLHFLTLYFTSWFLFSCERDHVRVMCVCVWWKMPGAWQYRSCGLLIPTPLPTSPICLTKELRVRRRMNGAKNSHRRQHIET